MTEVHLIATTKLTKGFYDLIFEMEQLGIADWHNKQMFSGDTLVEFCGRLCYRSWAPYVEGNPKLNANVQKVRIGNKKYIENILNSKHGSVLEHVNFTFLLSGVSRVLTHELVRHRAGMAYSQESLRYCKLEHLELVIPDSETELLDEESDKLFVDALTDIRKTVAKLNKLLLKDDISFFRKKRITSLIRRIAPIGINTSIIFTANARALRHIIEMRTSPHAEAEICNIFKRVAVLARDAAPNIFQDMKSDFTFENSKV
jgi:thymidylate synthase (FAD)